MNSLVNYASDSESESESEEPSILSTENKISSQSPSTLESTLNTQPKSSTLTLSTSSSIVADNDHQSNDQSAPTAKEISTNPVPKDDPMLAILDELHDFADSMNPEDEQPDSLESQDTQYTTDLVNKDEPDLLKVQTTPRLDSPESVTPVTPVSLTPEQQARFDTFLLEINSIPLTTKDQSQPPVSKAEIIAKEEIQAIEADLMWKKTQPVHAIYSRMHQLSILQSPGTNQKDIELQLIEFAIRILDWEKGGMKPGYFLGEERAAAHNKNELLKNKITNDTDMDVDTDEEMDVDDDGGDSTANLMPPYGGIVGEIIERMSLIEQAAAPTGWRVAWDQEECVYRFKHIPTGTISETYPSTEQLISLTAQ